MFDLLRIAAVFLLPLASAVVGFVIAVQLLNAHTWKRPGMMLAQWGGIALLSALQLVGEPAIEPLWLQYLVLVGGGLALGVAVFVGHAALSGRTASSSEDDD